MWDWEVSIYMVDLNVGKPEQKYIIYIGENAFNIFPE